MMQRSHPAAHVAPSRRQFLRHFGGGFGAIALNALLAEQSLATTSGVTAAPVDPLAARLGHAAPRAKRVIFLYMSGGVSHMDSFDPKPKLTELAGKPSNGKKGGRPFVRPLWDFKPGGTCGTMVSDLFPNVREVMDDVCLIRSMHGDHNDHFQATLGIHTGSVSFARPSIGSWVSYGLGTENQNLPSFVVLAPHLPYAGSQIWSSDFLPGSHQGTRVLAGPEPIPDLTRRAPSLDVQRAELGLLDEFNRRHLTAGRAGVNPQLSARVKSFETAFGMQQAMPDVLDLSRETDATLGLYGLERGSTNGFAWQCLIARRLVERGVRFVELIDSGASKNWDSHGNMAAHEPLAKNVDRPIAGLLRDLKSRGLLEDTLVVWTTEFGRTPTADGPKGRSHHASCFSSWLAGAGVKGGMVHGKSDDLGGKPVEDPVHVHDFHATILHLLGFDHERLTFRHAGRDFRLTDVHGRVVKDVLA